MISKWSSFIADGCNRTSPSIVYVLEPNKIRSPAIISASGGAKSVYVSVIPKTRPSSDNEVEAGCMEQPEMSFVETFSESQSKIVEPLDVVVDGLILVTVSRQKVGNI